MKQHIILLIIIFVSGCAIYKRTSTVSNRFLEDVDVTHKISNIPFDHAWVQPDFNGKDYKKVYIEPIVLRLDENAWKRSITLVTPTKEDFEREAEVIAKYFHDQIIQELNNYSEEHAGISKRKGHDTVVVKIALTEIEFSHPGAHAASLVSPVPGTDAALSAAIQAHMTFAMRVYTPNGRLVATAADQRFPPARIIDLNQLTVTSSNREIAQLWAETIAEVFHKGRFVKTEEKGLVSWLPW